MHDDNLISVLAEPYRRQCDDKMTTKFEWQTKEYETKLGEIKTAEYMHYIQAIKKLTWPKTDMTKITEVTWTWQTLTMNQSCDQRMTALL
jgi:hypothetical protein